MKEILSFWPLQEIIVDPDFPLSSGEEDVRLNLKVSADHRRGDGKVELFFEIFGSLTLKDEQVANVRFVNVTHVKPEGKRIATLKRKLLRERIKELLSFLPLYLSKSSIQVKSINYEL